MFSSLFLSWVKKQTSKELGWGKVSCKRGWKRRRGARTKRNCTAFLCQDRATWLQASNLDKELERKRKRNKTCEMYVLNKHVFYPSQQKEAHTSEKTIIIIKW